MTQTSPLGALEGRAVRLMVGNVPISAKVLEVSGLALKLSVNTSAPSVPRVRIELADAEAPLSSLQLQGMVTQRAADEVTVTLERLMVAADQELVDVILASWFTAVPRRDDCYQPMMRGFGYELRKAILSGRTLDDVLVAPRPARPPHDPSNDTLQGFPAVAVRAGMNDTGQAIPRAPSPEPGPLPPPAAAPVAEPPVPLAERPQAPRGALPPQRSRAGERLLAQTAPLQMSVDCSTEGAGYGPGVVYRLAAGSRLVFLAARGVRPNFGARVELITDLVQSGISVTVRIAASVSWQAPDPDYPQVTLMAVRLAPTNQPSHLHSWDVCCELALRESAQTSGAMSLVPSRAVIATIEP